MTTTPITQAEAVKIRNAREAIHTLMQDRRHWSTKRLAEEMYRRWGISCSDSAITARIRDLRKPEFGGFDVACTVSNSKTGGAPHRLYQIVGGGE